MVMDSPLKNFDENYDSNDLADRKITLRGHKRLVWSVMLEGETMGHVATAQENRQE